MNLEVLFQANFLLGEENKLNLKDYAYLSPNSLELLNDFVDRVENKQENCGTNKKSNDCLSLKQKKIVEKYNVFHYHVGVKNCSEVSCKNKKKCLDITQEKKNLTSSEVIHYMIKQNFLIILGYSSVHDNGLFPKFHVNPLLQRLKSGVNINMQTYATFLNYCESDGIESTMKNLHSYLEKIKKNG